ncbi:MAG: DNA-protecting protein DprA [Corynebacterium sp.]|uniref:DNA-processing protein DprA n=1 Tax=uncultured Corynebacterium sp. TaxID=159447 RepID=UPI0017BD2DC1|nr:DNA-processing protein DprA [uncultured Corynebacterium sp.]NLZ58378.1 DNA-protecting protein DprA [Corynebacterium sp.]
MSSTITDRLRAWAYLSRVVEGPSRNLQQLLADGRDVEAIAYGIKKREIWIGELLRETASRYDWDVAQQDLETVMGLGGRLITPDDSDWPLEELDRAFGFAATGMSDHLRTYQDDAVPPHALWVKGGNLRSLTSQAVAVVGTRAISHYGTEVTRMLVDNLVAHQWTIISGGALGVDTVAHTTALKAGGSTVVVAACGLDRSYPAHNRGLFQEIVDRGAGAIISEYPPGTTPQRHRFLTRNRLAAALSTGTVVTEAAWRSGALNTLSWCSGLGRVAMAVPGPVTTAGSLGCHERIRTGQAEMVCNGDEVRSLLGAIGELDVQGQYELQFVATPVQGLSRNELRVFDSLGQESQDAGQVAVGTGLPLALAVHLLVDLHKRGLVIREGTMWRRAG